MASTAAGLSRRFVVVAVATFLAIVGGTLAAVASDQLSAMRADQATNTRITALNENAVGAARQIAVDFAAYDYRHIDADFKRVADESIGQFHAQYLKESTGIRADIVKAKAVATAEVASAGLVQATPSQATVVLALNRTIRNTSAPTGRQDSFGLKMVLVRQANGWVASQVTPL